jgi:CheY-like chemotaxis protein/HPt (histidine-containing phosphotransfer) domain-containing protein
LRTLLVDDNAQALATSAAMMASLGWQVTQASSGEQALALLKASLDAGLATPDAIFVDWQMPGMDGWETLRNVRRLFGSGRPPLLIMLSRQSRDALAQRTDREQELLNGLMVKPLTAAMFERTLALARDGSPELDAQFHAPSQRLAGMRVLLVEDNHINQQVAQELLSAEGAIVTLADNGALGVEAVRQSDPVFDAVLMDLQMPVMDGISATRVLRSDTRFATLPVIAMTANAMSSDRDECLAAGMNDHIGKPFDLNRLVQTLIQHTRWVTRAVAVPAEESRAPAPAVAPAVRWPDGVDVDTALARMGGNKGLLQRSMAAFVSDARQLPLRLEQGAQDGDLAQVKRELHAFKGLAATMGVQQLSELSAQAEKLVLAPQRRGEYQAMLGQLAERVAELLPSLEDVVGRLAATAPVEARVRTVDKALVDQLKALLLALQASDMSAVEMHATLRQGLEDSLGATMETLDAAMSELEFEEAAVACERLVRQFDTI